MGTYHNFQRYIDFDDLTFDELTQVTNYICGNLNSPSFIFPYWFDMYSYTSKTFQVIALRKSTGEEAKAKLGEVSVSPPAVCKNCLTDGMYRIPYEIIKFEAKVRGKMDCIWKFRSGEIPMMKCCCGCINFILCNYGSCFLIEI